MASPERKMETEWSIETEWVSQFLKEQAITDIESSVVLWRSTDLPLERLADSLRFAVENVDRRARSNGHRQAIDLGRVDWLELAEHYAEMFD